jgi:hypothetical protein
MAGRQQATGFCLLLVGWWPKSMMSSTSRHHHLTRACHFPTLLPLSHLASPTHRTNASRGKAPAFTGCGHHTRLCLLQRRLLLLSRARRRLRCWRKAQWLRTLALLLILLLFVLRRRRVSILLVPCTPALPIPATRQQQWRLLRLLGAERPRTRAHARAAKKSPTTPTKTRGT